MEIQPPNPVATPRPCQSWEHVGDPGPPASARVGTITCAAHNAEEEEYRRVFAELSAVANAMTARAGEHPRSIGDRAESAVHDFLDARLRARGIRIARVFQNRKGRRQRELDRAAPIDDREGTWDAGSRTLDEHTPLALHIEITRERYGPRKFLGDIGKLLTSARTAVDQGAPGLPFTVFVALGRGWRVEPMMAALHNSLHTGVQPERLGGCEWWPIVDVIVIPGAVLKKHEVMMLEDPCSVWPAYQHFSTAPDTPMRGLAPARTFLEHRVDQLLGRRPMDSDAFGYASDLATFGPRSLAIDAARSSLRAYLMRDPRLEHQRFAFDAWHRRAGIALAMEASLDVTLRCACGMPFMAAYEA